MFKIQDIDFQLSHARVYSRLTEDKMMWSIEVKSKPLIIKELTWEPLVYSERLLGLERANYQHWMQYLNTTLRWTDCYDPQAMQGNAFLYVFTHEDIYQSTLQLTMNKSGQGMLTWHGLCNVFSDEEYGGGISLDIECPYIYEGIWWYGSHNNRPSYENARRMISHFTEPESYDVALSDDGAHWKYFRPKIVECESSKMPG